MADEALIREFLDPRNVFAVVGVSADPAKYGHRVFFDLLGAGYRVFAIHPQGGEVDGHARYPALSALPQRPDVVVLVVPPAAGEKVVEECAALGIGKVWMQPGAEGPQVLAACEKHGIRALHSVCIMVQRRQAGG